MKNRIIYTISLIILIIGSFSSCNKKEDVLSQNEQNTRQRRILYEGEEVIDIDKPIFISNYSERANPYSLDNMRIALDLIREELESPCGLPNTIDISEITFSIDMQPTDYYVALYPDNSIDYKMWADTCLFPTTPFSLLLEDVDGLYGGEMIYLSDIDQEVPVLYGTCSADSLDQLNASGVNYNIIETLFIPENSPELPDYRQWYLDTIPPDFTEIDGHFREQRDFVKAITNYAFRIAGYETEEVGPVEEEECERKHFLWWSWSDCDTFHHPTGRITVETPTGETGVSGIKVRLFRWFTTHDVYTDGNGQYYDTNRWEKLCITDDIFYTIITSGKREIANNINQWDINTSIIQGAISLWPYRYNCGFHSSSGYSVKFLNSSSNFWSKCIVNNAIYDYCVYAENEHLTLPPSYLSIATSDESDNGWISSCPLLKNHINVSLMDIPFIGPFLEMFYLALSPIIYTIAPDLILKYSTDISDYDKMTSIIWHELTHSSHFQRTVFSSGLTEASYYWSEIISYEGEYYLNTGHPYGSVNVGNWEIIALAEGWANYREWYMGNVYLGYDNQKQYEFGNRKMLDRYYSLFFSLLYNHGISMREMEHALANTHSLSEFKDNLLSICPNKSGIINTYLP